MIEYKDPVAEQIKAYILDDPPFTMDMGSKPAEPLWQKIRAAGSQIWIHGNEDLAAEIWSREINAYYLCTRSLHRGLDKESPDFPVIAKAGKFLKGMPERERTQEILFILHARRLLRISHMLSTRVITEIPVADDSTEEICRYVRRLYQIAPERISPVLPYTIKNSAAATNLCPDKIPLTLSGIHSPKDAVDAAEYVTSGIIIEAREGSAPETLAWSVMEAVKDSGHGNRPPNLIISGISQADEITGLTGFPVLKLHVNTARIFLKKPGFRSQASSSTEWIGSDRFYRTISALL